MQLSGATAVVTGATGGIGHAIARSLRGAGAEVIVTGRRADVLDPLAQELGGRALAFDLARREEVQRLIESVSDADVVVANAALPATGTVESLSEEQIDRILDVNLRTPIVMARALWPGMRDRGGGHLVFISSLAGKAAAPSSSLYNATKFGLRGFAHALRADLHGTGVGVSCICPGFVSEAGMFADAKVDLPRGVSTVTPQQVADGVLSAIDRDRAEVDVAPVMLRGLSAFSSVAPGIAGSLSRRMGAHELSESITRGQADKR